MEASKMFTHYCEYEVLSDKLDLVACAECSRRPGDAQ